MLYIGNSARCKGRSLPSTCWELLTQVCALAILAALHWIRSSFSRTLLNCKAQNATLCSKCDWTSSKYRRQSKFFQLVGHSVPDAAQYRICFPHSEEALLAYIQASTFQNPHILSRRARAMTLPCYSAPGGKLHFSLLRFFRFLCASPLRFIEVSLDWISVICDVQALPIDYCFLEICQRCILYHQSIEEDLEW